MGARRAAASMNTEEARTQPGRPAELARVLRALAVRSGGRASAACALGDPGRAVPEHLHQPGGRRRGRAARKARRAGLGWKVYDEELVEAIAHRMGSPIEEVRALDELAPSMVQDWLLPLREEYYAPQEAYLDHLAKMIEAIGRAGESVLVGRGAGFMLPRDTTLSIRVIAPIKVRAQRLAERMGVSPRTARAGRPRARSAPCSVRPHDAPGQPKRPAQLRPGAQHRQPRSGNCRGGDHQAP